MTIVEAISKRILELCSDRDITLNKLATISGITQSTLDSIIKGKSKNPSITTLKKIADGLGITISEFLNTHYIHESTYEE